MREILFRGFHPCDGPETIVVDGEKMTGRWVEGSLIHRTSYYGEPCDDYFIVTDGEFDSDYYDAERVLPSTVGQWTGLTDKNGKRFFEGDRISHRWADWDHSPTQHIVRWENNSCGFEPFSDSEENCHHCGGGLPPDDCEVIGTVFDEGALNAQT